MQLRASIATYNDLPISSNYAGDVRRVIDTGIVYIWISQSSSDVITKWFPCGNGGAGDLDGGFANSVYLVSQISDGGNA